MRKRELVLQAVTIVLAFGVGILIGQNCEQEPEKTVETVTVTRTVPPEIVYECPPDAGGIEAAEQSAAAPKSSKASSSKKAEKALPQAPRPITPLERKRLLGWVRDQSADLDGCRGGGNVTHRLAVTLKLDDDGNVKDARVNAPDDVPRNVVSCLRSRMSNWTPPADLVSGRPELVFGLTL